MIPIFGMAAAKVGDVPVGRLVLSTLYEGGPFNLALRVRDVSRSPADDDALLVFRVETPHGLRPGVLPYRGDSVCVDLGDPVFAIEQQNLPDAFSTTTYGSTPGALALSGKELFVLACYGDRLFQQAWWHIGSGEPQRCKNPVVVGKWLVGTKKVDGTFAPQLSYPKDFARALPDC